MLDFGLKREGSGAFDWLESLDGQSGKLNVLFLLER